jgi:hypothetical protein
MPLGDAGSDEAGTRETQPQQLATPFSPGTPPTERCARDFARLSARVCKQIYTGDGNPVLICINFSMNRGAVGDAGLHANFHG